MIWILLIVAVFSLLSSALLSAAETAVFTIGYSRLRTLEEEGFQGSKALADLRVMPESARFSLLILNTILNTVSVGLSVTIGILITDTPGGLLGILIGVIAVVIIGEIIPRFLATKRPLRLALSTAHLLIFIERTLNKIINPIDQLTDLIFSSKNDKETTNDERDVREITELGQKEGLVGIEEHILVERAFHLDELTAWDVMTPRVDIFAWKDSLTLKEIIDELETVPYSRVPVYRETTDDISGILYVREAYENYVAGRTSMTLSQLSQDPIFVPGSLPLTQLLRQFQNRRIHMGIVADEFGGTDGLATLEDILEELVGDIVDETDPDNQDILHISRTEIEAAGSIDVRDIKYIFNIAFPQLDNRSLNGFILEELGYVPKVQETFKSGGLQVKILEASDTQVTRALLTKLPSKNSEEIT
tara:strand:+ start:359 stop:1615 length:1257 start_codon:yes stop_codon:yes gene_type:complete